MTAVARPWYSPGKRGPSRNASRARRRTFSRCGEPALLDLLAERVVLLPERLRLGARVEQAVDPRVRVAERLCDPVGRDLERAQHARPPLPARSRPARRRTRGTRASRARARAARGRPRRAGAGARRRFVTRTSLRRDAGRSRPAPPSVRCGSGAPQKSTGPGCGSRVGRALEPPPRPCDNRDEGGKIHETASPSWMTAPLIPGRRTTGREASWSHTGRAPRRCSSAAPEDVGERPDAATVTVGRDEIEEALASDAPLELILSVGRDASTPQDVRVAWQRSDLETVLAGADAGGVTFSFDRAELARALEQPDFEGHGIREMVLLTVAAASASAAMAVSTASGQLLEGTGGGGAAAAVVAPGHGEATTARDLAAASVDRPRSRRGVDGRCARCVGGDPRRGDACGTGCRPDRAGRRRGHTRLSRNRHRARGLAGAWTRRPRPPASRASRESTTRRLLPRVASARRFREQTRRPSRLVGSRRRWRTTRRRSRPAASRRPRRSTSSTGFELPSLDSGSAAAIGGLAGAGLLILGAAFAARRQGARPA